MKSILYSCLALFSLVAVGESQVRQSLLLNERFLQGESLLWSPAFQKCWDETAKAVGWESIPLKPETDVVRQLNSFEWKYEETVPGRTHFVFVSGTGDSFREKANKLIKRHFGTAVPPLDEGYFESLLGPEDLASPPVEMILLSILKHDLNFETSFEKEPESRVFVTGTGAIKTTRFFGSWGEHREKFGGAATILNHAPERKAYSLAFQGASPDELLILVRDDSLKSIEDTVAATRRFLSADSERVSNSLTQTDTLLIPEVNLDSFVDLAGNLRGLADDGIRKVAIARAGQRIRLKLDQKGASMVTAAFLIPLTYLSSSGGDDARGPAGRRFVFDRPFQLMLWRRGAEWPFLFAHIDADSLVAP